MCALTTCGSNLEKKNSLLDWQWQKSTRRLSLFFQKNAWKFGLHMSKKRGEVSLLTPLRTLIRGSGSFGLNKGFQDSKGNLRRSRSYFKQGINLPFFRKKCHVRVVVSGSAFVKARLENPGSIQLQVFFCCSLFSFFEIRRDVTMVLAMHTVGVSVEDSLRPRPYVHSYSVRLLSAWFFSLVMTWSSVESNQQSLDYWSNALSIELLLLLYFSFFLYTVCICWRSQCQCHKSV